SPDEKVREVNAGFGAGEIVLTIFPGQISFINLIVVKRAAKTNRVRPHHLGEIVEHLEGIVVLPCADLGNPDLERVENHVRYTFEFGLDGTDAARGAPWRHEAHVTEAKVRTDTTSRCGQHQRIPHVAETKFVDRERAEVPGITQIDHLRATRRYCI